MSAAEVFSAVNALWLADGVGLGLLRPAPHSRGLLYCDVACHCGDCVARFSAQLRDFCGAMPLAKSAAVRLHSCTTSFPCLSFPFLSCTILTKYVSLYKIFDIPSVQNV